MISNTVYFLSSQNSGLTPITRSIRIAPFPIQFRNIYSGRPPVVPSRGNAVRDKTILLGSCKVPSMRYCPVFVTPLAPPEGKPAAFLNPLTPAGFVVVQEAPPAFESPPNPRHTLSPALISGTATFPAASAPKSPIDFSPLVMRPAEACRFRGGRQSKKIITANTRRRRINTPRHACRWPRGAPCSLRP
jgi:hypothetical protein